MSPSVATALRWLRAVAPTSRSSAMVRVRPTMTVANVFAVTTAET